MSQEVDPRFLLDDKTKGRAEKLKGKTYFEAILYTLTNQALGEDTRASDVILRELRHVDKEDPGQSPFFQAGRFQIEVVYSDDEYERLEKIEQRLIDRYGEDYEDLLWNATP